MRFLIVFSLLVSGVGAWAGPIDSFLANPLLLMREALKRRKLPPPAVSAAEPEPEPELATESLPTPEVAPEPEELTSPPYPYTRAQMTEYLTRVAGLPQASAEHTQLRRQVFGLMIDAIRDWDSPRTLAGLNEVAAQLSRGTAAGLPNMFHVAYNQDHPDWYLLIRPMNWYWEVKRRMELAKDDAEALDEQTERRVVMYTYALHKVLEGPTYPQSATYGLRTLLRASRYPHVRVLTSALLSQLEKLHKIPVPRPLSDLLSELERSEQDFNQVLARSLDPLRQLDDHHPGTPTRTDDGGVRSYVHAREFESDPVVRRQITLILKGRKVPTSRCNQLLTQDTLGD